MMPMHPFVTMASASRAAGIPMMGAMTQDLGQHLADANDRAMNATGMTEKDMLMNSVAPGVEMQQASYRRSPSSGNLQMGMTM
jgi:hypothetical protein